jgi:proline iminopeptidase
VPLVVVHGGPGATHDYLEPLVALGTERPVVFYDQLGAGRSDAPNDLSLWTNDRLVAELTTLIDSFPYPTVHLLGQSWGALVVTEYALRQPARVAGLVLADPVLSVPRFAAGTVALRSALPPEVRQVLDRHEASGTTDSEEYQTATLAFYNRHMCRLDPWPEPFQRSISQMNMVVYEQMYGPNDFTVTGTEKDYDLTDRLDRLDVPVLFLCGRYDWSRPEDTAFFSELIRGAEIVVFEESSHMPHLEEPDLYLQVLRTFLARSESADDRAEREPKVTV